MNILKLFKRKPSIELIEQPSPNIFIWKSKKTNRTCIVLAQREDIAKKQALLILNQ